MEVLADKVHKKGEHNPQHCYISHNHVFFSTVHNTLKAVQLHAATGNCCVIDVWAVTSSVKMAFSLVAHRLEIVGRYSMQSIFLLQTKHKFTILEKFPRD